jgi:hypothetical protein
MQNFGLVSDCVALPLSVTVVCAIADAAEVVSVGTNVVKFNTAPSYLVPLDVPVNWK